MTEQQQPLSNETMLAVLQERFSSHARQTNERLDQLRIDYSELKSSLTADITNARTEVSLGIRELNEREKERNGQIRELTLARQANDQRWMEHLADAGADKEQLRVLTARDHDADIRNNQWRRMGNLGWELLRLAVMSGVITLAAKGLGVL